MPYVNVKIVKQQVTPNQKDLLINGLMDIIVKIMDRDPELTVITLDEIDQRNWFIGGEPLSKNQDVRGMVCYIEINISQGTSKPSQMAEVIKAGKELAGRVLGSNDLTNYIVIHEHNPDSWGFDGISMTVRTKMEQN
jgi:4-oxalocrotonate tautomerase